MDPNPFLHNNRGPGRENVGPGRSENNYSWDTPGPHVTLKIRANCVWSTLNYGIKPQTPDLKYSFHNFQSHFLRLGNMETVELFVWRFFSEVDEPLSFQECLKMPRNFMDHFAALDSLLGHCWPSSQASSGSQLPHSSNHFFAGVCF